MDGAAPLSMLSCRETSWKRIEKNLSPFPPLSLDFSLESTYTYYWYLDSTSITSCNRIPFVTKP